MNRSCFVITCPETNFTQENFILVYKQRRIRGVYNGTLPPEAERLIDDMNTLLKEEN